MSQEYKLRFVADKFHVSKAAILNIMIRLHLLEDNHATIKNFTNGISHYMFDDEAIKKIEKYLLKDPNKIYGTKKMAFECNTSEYKLYSIINKFNLVDDFHIIVRVNMKNIKGNEKYIFDEIAVKVIKDYIENGIEPKYPEENKDNDNLEMEDISAPFADLLYDIDDNTAEILEKDKPSIKTDDKKDSDNDELKMFDSKTKEDPVVFAVPEKVSPSLIDDFDFFVPMENNVDKKNNNTDEIEIEEKQEENNEEEHINLNNSNEFSSLFSEIERKYNKLQQTNNDLFKKHKELHYLNNELENKYNNLTEDYKKLKVEYDDLNNNHKNLKEDYKLLENKIEELKEKNQELSNFLDDDIIENDNTSEILLEKEMEMNLKFIELEDKLNKKIINFSLIFSMMAVGEILLTLFIIYLLLK